MSPVLKLLFFLKLNSLFLHQIFNLHKYCHIKARESEAFFFFAFSGPVGEIKVIIYEKAHENRHTL